MQNSEVFSMDAEVAIVSSPWYRSLNREQWRVLLASNLGWLFDGFEIYALFLTVGFALHQLLDAAQYTQIPRYAGYILATTVFGWATGGVIGGIIADYIGRKRTMMLAILAYSLTTALSAVAWNWQSFAVLRFLVGVGIGSEMGDRRVARRRIVARPRPRQGRRAAAKRRWDRQLSCLGCVANPRRIRTQRLALDVCGGSLAGAACVLDPSRHAGIGPLGGCERAAARGARAAGQRGRTRRRKRRADAVHGHRHVSRPQRSRAAYRGIFDDAVGNLGVLGRRHLCPDICRDGRCQGRFVGAVLLCVGGVARHWGRNIRLCRPRLLRRLDRPQADGDDLVFDVPDPDAGRLHVGPVDGRVARRRDRLRLFHGRDLGLGADLVARAFSDADARHRCRILL